MVRVYIHHNYLLALLVLMIGMIICIGCTSTGLHREDFPTGASQDTEDRTRHDTIDINQ